MSAVSRLNNTISNLEQQCARKGLRMTPQRRVIARVLSEAKDHPDTNEVHRRAVKHDPKISLATIYRTMRIFEQEGILARHDFGSGRAHYEDAKTPHHDHLIDMQNGHVIEFRDTEIEKLQEAIARKLGYRLIAHKLELYGVPCTDKK